MSLRNPGLFRQLERLVGKGNVTVVAEGEAMKPVYRRVKVQTPGGKLQITQKLVSQDSDPGEEYRIDCPFCGDDKQRLYVNHRWGVLDKKTGTRNWWLIHCWNEECVAEYTNRQAFIEMLEDGAIPDKLAKGVTEADYAAEPYKAVEPPGPLWSLEKLARYQPQHEAIEYLVDRAFDPVYLSRRFGCGYVLDSEFAFAHQRIYAPIVMDGELVNWQCRYVGEAKKETRIPKWFTKPKTKKKYHIYNYDLMRMHQTKVIVEGPSSTWGVGPAAGGILGKRMSRHQAELIVKACQPEDTVVLLLDPEQDAKDAAKGKPHHIEKAYELLTGWRQMRKRVVRVYLPLGTDPGSVDREFCYDYIRERAEEQKVRVCFRRPRKE